MRDYNNVLRGHRTRGNSLLLLTCLGLLLSGFIHGAVPESERAALIALYNATNGDNWSNNRGWKTPPLHSDGFAMPGTEDNWIGISIWENHVRYISLGNKKLNGSIPPELVE